MSDRAERRRQWDALVAEHDLHRRFAAALNNEVWKSLVAGEPNADSPMIERERLVYAAHASAHHWFEAGGPENHARAEHLIARAAVQAGFPRLALRHAERCLEWCEQHPGVMEDWDAAFAHEAIARAHAALGDADAARRHREISARLGEAISDDDDREVFVVELRRGPWFGMA